MSDDSLDPEIDTVAEGERVEVQTERSRGVNLDVVHWHLMREDGQRFAISTRAGAVLSTNALVVAGTALALSLSGARSLPLWVSLTALMTLLVVASSVTYASQALVMLRRTERRFSEPRTDASTLYNLSGISCRWATFAEFRAAMMEQSPAQQLAGALDELWRVTQLHRYRYLKLRKATWLLLASVSLSALTHFPSRGPFSLKSFPNCALTGFRTGTTNSALAIPTRAMGALTAVVRDAPVPTRASGRGSSARATRSGSETERSRVAPDSLPGMGDQG